MCKLKESDFYYGAVLSALFNGGVCPMIVEGGADRQLYEFTTNEGDFKMFLKYRSAPNRNKGDSQSWTFVFSDKDITELCAIVASNKHLALCLVCGNKDKLGESQHAVLHKEDVKAVLDAGKNSVTVSRVKGEHAFRLSMGGGRDNARLLHSNRLY